MYYRYNDNWMSKICNICSIRHSPQRWHWRKRSLFPISRGLPGTLRHDPSRIWADADMTAFGPNDRGATITEVPCDISRRLDIRIVSQIENAE